MELHFSSKYFNFKGFGFTLFSVLETQLGLSAQKSCILSISCRSMIDCPLRMKILSCMLSMADLTMCLKYIPYKQLYFSTMRQTRI